MDSEAISSEFKYQFHYLVSYVTLGKLLNLSVP